MWHENMAKVSLLKEKFVKKKEGRKDERKEEKKKEGWEREVCKRLCTEVNAHPRAAGRCSKAELRITTKSGLAGYVI